MIFYYPILAIINLFICILKNPAAETVQSDLAFLDIGAGHFGQVHLLTCSKMSFSFPRDVVGVAQRAVRKASTNVSSAGREEADQPQTFSADLFEVPVSSYAILYFISAANTPCKTGFFGESVFFESWNTLPAEFFDNFSLAGEVDLL
jgi:hypothetical protein